jgi:hypothetical protein
LEEEENKEGTVQKCETEKIFIIIIIIIIITITIIIIIIIFVTTIILIIIVIITIFSPCHKLCDLVLTLMTQQYLEII